MAPDDTRTTRCPWRRKLTKVDTSNEMLAIRGSLDSETMEEEPNLTTMVDMMTLSEEGPFERCLSILEMCDKVVNFESGKKKKTRIIFHHRVYNINISRKNGSAIQNIAYPFSSLDVFMALLAFGNAVCTLDRDLYFRPDRATWQCNAHGKRGHRCRQLEDIHPRGRCN